MKSERRNKLFSIFILLVFAVAHFPVTLFHQHEHPPECTISSKDIKNTGESHYHENENEHCFICSASVKNDCGIIVAYHLYYDTVSFQNYLPGDNSFLALTPGINNSRAPPFILG